jgi:hypothetical protein
VLTPLTDWHCNCVQTLKANITEVEDAKDMWAGFFGYIVLAILIAFFSTVADYLYEDV